MAVRKHATVLQPTACADNFRRTATSASNPPGTDKRNAVTLSMTLMERTGEVAETGPFEVWQLCGGDTRYSAEGILYTECGERSRGYADMFIAQGEWATGLIGGIRSDLRLHVRHLRMTPEGLKWWFNWIPRRACRPRIGFAISPGCSSPDIASTFGQQVTTINDPEERQPMNDKTSDKPGALPDNKKNDTRHDSSRIS